VLASIPTQTASRKFKLILGYQNMGHSIPRVPVHTTGSLSPCRPAC